MRCSCSCSPMGNIFSRALKRLREGKGKRKKSHRGHESRPEERMARSVSHGNENPIYVAHPPAEISTTWNPPQKLPDTPAPHPTHGFSDTAETKHVVEERYADPDTSAHDYYGPRDSFHPRQESDFGRYSSYNDSSVTGREYEESGSSNKGEYLCGEYQYYPTPVREGIYNLATDGNRLASIFSDENPNACTIA